MSKLDFKILKKRGNARVGEITLNWVKLQTPIFMPVGTKATIKWLILDLLKDPKYIGELPAINLILANTFHLYLRPWDELIKQAGWLHEFEDWKDGLILTDSGWFQVFSLWLGKDKDLWNKNAHSVNIKLTEDGVKFSSPFDGSKHFFSPEKVVDIQSNFGSDIMMVLDVCSPWDADKDTINKQMQMTHRRANRAYEHFMPSYDQTRWVLFPIVQWWSHTDLREESIQYLSKFATDGIAIWGVSVWEDSNLIRSIVEFTAPKLPEDKPRYLMWVGTPKDLLHAIEQWVDMFDCVLATRLGRHWVMFSDEWDIKITNARYKNDFSPISDVCPFTQKYTKAYVHHLLREKEVLWWIILSFHNILYLHRMLENWKKDMLNTI